MDSLIGGLFGGNDDDDDRKSQARDFISRYEQGPIDQGYDEDEAFNNFQRVSQHADPETMHRASEQAFSRMDPDQRTQFAQYLQQQQQDGGQSAGRVSGDPREMAGMVSQMQRQNPGGLSSLLGGGGNSGGGGIGNAIGGLLGGGGSGGGFPGGNVGKVALGGIAAFAMKEMLGGGGDDNKKRKRSI